MDHSNYYEEIRNDFDREARKSGGMFSKDHTECDRLSIEYLKKMVNPEMTVLEVGAGMGNVIEALDCDKYAIDLSPEMLKNCIIENKQVADMDNPPFPDEKFDLVYMIMTLQQSYDQKATINALKRILKPTGALVVIDGDRDSTIGRWREDQMKKGEWETCGKARWLSRKNFPEAEVANLDNHILILKFKKQ